MLRTRALFLPRHVGYGARRHILGTVVCPSISSLGCSSTRYCSNNNNSGGGGGKSRAELEALARQRLAESPPSRTIERNAPPDVARRQPAQEEETPASPRRQRAETTAAAGAAASASSSSSSTQANIRGAEEEKEEERARKAKLEQLLKERMAENEAVPPRRFERGAPQQQDQQEEIPVVGMKTEHQQQQSVKEGEDTQATSPQQSVTTSASSSSSSSPAGSTVVFDVPEGETPRQQAYDPWSILGLKPGASNHDIRVRYHELLEQFHPDYCKDGSGGDVQKWADIDRAYQLVTKAPAHDKRYRNLITDKQQFYYRYLPEWMSKNVDEMPRYWSWMRFRVPSAGFALLWLCALYAIGKISAIHPMLGKCCLLAFVIDVLAHTSVFPVMFFVLLCSLLLTGNEYDIAWLTSPKAFLRRPLQY